MKQEEYFNTGALQGILEILNRYESNKIFLVTGKESFESSGAKSITDEILENYEITYFNNFTPNPKFEDILKGIIELRNSGSDIVIAIGGGGVIDTAKSINILSEQKDDPKSIIEGREKIKNKGKILIAIPTTSGSGSEATHFAVVFIGKDKYSLANPNILPDCAIIDPELSYSLPANITATSGIDAFSQAVESYWSVNSTIESKKYSRDAIKIILNNLPQAVNNPAPDCRINMSKAANLAGKAINITKTTAPHAISYSMTSYFGINHGQAVSVSLAEFLEFNYEVTDKDITVPGKVNMVKTSIEELVRILGCKNIKESKIKINNLIYSIGLKTKLSELNINSDRDLKVLIENVNTERLQNNPRIISKENLEKVIGNIF